MEVYLVHFWHEMCFRGSMGNLNFGYGQMYEKVRLRLVYR
jgi:hypothetical protein